MAYSRSLAVASLLATVVLCLAAPPVHAQAGQPCSQGQKTAEAAKVELAKEAFFGAMAAAGERIGERGIDRAAEGIATGNPERTRVGIGGAQTGRALQRATRFVDRFDSFILDPINAYLEDPSEEALNSAYGKFLENVARMALEKAGERVLHTSAFGAVGLVLEGGRFVIGSSQWAVEEMIDASQRQQIEATLFGRGSDVALGTVNNLFSQEPFFTSGPVVNRGWTRENIGRMAKSEEELEKVWKLYGDFLKGGPLSTRQGRADTDRMLVDGWPHLRRFWSFKRAETFVEAGRFEFTKGMTRLQDRASRGDLTVCEEPPPPTPPPAAPVKGAFGPATKSFGSLPAPFENHEHEINGTMSATSFRLTLERKPSSEGAMTIRHDYSGSVPEILKPGDVIDLSCVSTAVPTGTYPPNIGGSCHWYVEGSVTIDTTVSTPRTFVGIASDGKRYLTGESRTRFTVGKGGRILIRAAQGGHTWGTTDNWNPAEYVYTFVP